MGVDRNLRRASLDTRVIIRGILFQWDSRALELLEVEVESFLFLATLELARRVSIICSFIYMGCYMKRETRDVEGR